MCRLNVSETADERRESRSALRAIEGPDANRVNRHARSVTLSDSKLALNEAPFPLAASPTMTSG